MKKYFLVLVYCLSCSLFAGEFQKLIPCDAHFNLETYPALENPRTVEMINSWTKNLDEFFKNPTVNAEEFMKSTMMPAEFHTITLMIEKLETKNLKQSLRDNFETALTKFNIHNVELVRELYPAYFEKRLDTFLEKLKSIKQSGNVSYYDLTYSGKEFSTLVDPFQNIGNFSAELQSYTRNLNDANFNVDQFVEFYTKKSAPNLKMNMSHFPFFMAIPTFESLGFKAMNKMNGIPVFYVGMIEEAVVVDGHRMVPTHFHFHDYTHIDALVQKINEKLLRWDQAKMHNFYGNRAEITADVYQNVIKTMLTINETYGKYSKILNDKEKFTGFERVLGEGLFFYLTHEEMLVNEFIHPEQLKNFLLQLPHERQPILDSFLRRINDQNDLGQAFKATAPVRTAEQVTQLIHKIVINL